MEDTEDFKPKINYEDKDFEPKINYEYAIQRIR